MTSERNLLHEAISSYFDSLYTSQFSRSFSIIKDTDTRAHATRWMADVFQNIENRYELLKEEVNAEEAERSSSGA